MVQTTGFSCLLTNLFYGTGTPEGVPVKIVNKPYNSGGILNVIVV